MLLRPLVTALAVMLGATVAMAQGINLNSTPRKTDNSDGCGQQRLAVELGRENIARDKFYKEDQPWFQDRLAALKKCVDSLPQRQAAAAAQKQAWQTSKATSEANANTYLIVAFLIGLPLAVFLSYAQSAGVAGNAALVRLRDWKGTPMFIWSALAFGAVIWWQAIGWYFAGGYGSHDFGYAIGTLAAVAVWFVSLFVAAGLAFGYVRDGLWATLKGIPALLHYLLVRHPVAVHLPASATDAIARRDFARAIREHGPGLKSFWREMMTPSFVRRHKLERAAQVEAQIRADTSILKAAMERESARAAHLDSGSAS